MTKREAMELTATQNRLMALGMSGADTDALRRISMTLRRWFERECGDENGCIERDETTGKPYYRSSWEPVFNGMRRRSEPHRMPIADRETGARKRLAAIMAKYPTLTAYVQGDSRGCSLYILTAEQLASEHGIDSIYNRGIAIG
jgi:hypothetical protein